MSAIIDPAESDRLGVLRSYAVLDTPAEPPFDQLAQLAAHICGTPTALITLIDAERQWFKSCIGFDATETPREDSVCARIMHTGTLTELRDLAADPRFASLRLVREAPRLRFYAGVPLVTPSGQPLGTLCVIDYRPRELDELQREALRVLAAQVMAQLELRRNLRDKSRAESALLGILEDERAAQSALRKSEHEQRELARRLAMAQHVAKVGSWETDLATLNVTWSEETHRIFETDPAVFRPTHAAFLQIVHPEDRPRVDQALTRSLENGEGPHMVEHRLRFPDGRVKFIEERWQIIQGPDGKPREATGTCQDVTERKKLEDQFLRAQRMESIGTLAGGIAHDLNNLLSPIVMGIDLVRQFSPDPRAERVLDNMERSAKRGADLVRQVLSFARGVDGARVSVSIDALTSEIAEIARNTFPKNIEFTRLIAPGLSPVVGDPTQLNQVLLNLCVNARDAMPSGGKLLLAARNCEIDAQFASMSPGAIVGHHVMIEVRDNGTGMPKEISDRIFEPFFTTKAPGSGTGLGLSTVLGIVRSHGGFIHVYSEPGKGSTFKVYLPVAANAPASHPEEPAAPALPRGKGEWVLVVDDEASVLGVTKQTLEIFGYHVLTAEDGAQAIAVFARQPEKIRLIITDMMMPVMDGLALIAAIRRLNPTLPIIAASGLASNHGVAQASAAGVHHFLTKPFTTDTLLQVARKALAEATA
ncbi:MAG: response regulator [Opitutaceae bacterium]|jgi:PAS domain S-box-containing protein|nr:response regulator [Opitutaceae bacterium]